MSEMQDDMTMVLDRFFEREGEDRIASMQTPEERRIYDAAERIRTWLAAGRIYLVGQPGEMRKERDEARAQRDEAKEYQCHLQDRWAEAKKEIERLTKAVEAWQGFKFSEIQNASGLDMVLDPEHIRVNRKAMIEGTEKLNQQMDECAMKILRTHLAMEREKIADLQAKLDLATAPRVEVVEYSLLEAMRNERNDALARLESAGRTRDAVIKERDEALAKAKELEERLHNNALCTNQHTDELTRQRDAARAQAAKNAKSMNNQRAEICRLTQQLAWAKAKRARRVKEMAEENAKFVRDAVYHETAVQIPGGDWKVYDCPALREGLLDAKYEPKTLHQEIARLKKEKEDWIRSADDLTEPLRREIHRLKAENEGIIKAIEAWQARWTKKGFAPPAGPHPLLEEIRRLQDALGEERCRVGQQEATIGKVVDENRILRHFLKTKNAELAGLREGRK